MRLTPKVEPSTSLTVRLTPSMATEPLRATYLAKCSGTVIFTRVERASTTREATLATPSTCPDTRCPPNASPALSDGSRFTAEPTASSPSVVTESVSRETSAAKARSRIWVTVRQQPCTQMLSPRRRPDGSIRSRPITVRTSPPQASCTCTVPTSRTIPVNTGDSCSGFLISIVSRSTT